MTTKSGEIRGRERRKGLRNAGKEDVEEKTLFSVSFERFFPKEEESKVVGEI